MEAINNTLLDKQSESTKKAYDRIKKSYEIWKNNRPHSDDLVAEWIQHEAKTKAPTTLWTQVSLLTKYLECEQNIKIDRSKINSYLKVLTSTHKKKQACAFTKEELTQFLKNHSNEDAILVKKLYILLAYYGALRTSEATYLTFRDINISSEGLLVTIVRKKTDKAGIGEVKLIPREDDPLLDPIKIFQAYSDAVPSKERLWLQYNHKLNKYINSPIGKNSLAKIASEVAKYLGKENPESYTGHAFRVTSATVLADEGISVTNLKRHGGWKSDSVAENYIRNSKKIKIDTANLLSLADTKNTSKTSSSNTTFVFNNCVFNGSVKFSAENSNSSQ